MTRVESGTPRLRVGTVCTQGISSGYRGFDTCRSPSPCSETASDSSYREAFVKATIRYRAAQQQGSAVTCTGIAPVNVGLKDRLPHLQNTGRSVPCGTRTRVSTLRGLRPWPSRRMEHCTPNASSADVGLEPDRGIAPRCKLYESLLVARHYPAEHSADPLGIEPS